MESPTEFAFSQGVSREDTKDMAKIKLGECYEEIQDILKYYMDISEKQSKLDAIWVIGTYFHQKFETYPFLFFNAMRGSGKTRMLKLISHLSANGDGGVLNNITEAVLFRHPKGHIMCLDEIESIGSKEKQTLRELLNASYKKGMRVKRMKKTRVDGQEMQVTESFEPYFPIAMANIWGIEEVLGDRSITQILEKSNNPAIIKKLESFSDDVRIQNIKRTLKQISDVCDVTLLKKTYITAWNSYIHQRYNNISSSSTLTTLTAQTTEDIEREEFFLKLDTSGIVGRNLELTYPLLIISKMISEDTFEELLKIIKEIVLEKKDEEYSNSKDVSLYQFVAEFGNDKEIKSLKELTAHFRLFVGDSEKEEQWVNEKWMGRALKRLCLITMKRKYASGMFVLLNVGKAMEKLQMFRREDDKAN